MGYASWWIIKLGNSLVDIGAVLPPWFLFVIHFQCPKNYILVPLHLFLCDLTCFWSSKLLCPIFKYLECFTSGDHELVCKLLTFGAQMIIRMLDGGVDD
jgi:hypothetical protein